MLQQEEMQISIFLEVITNTLLIPNIVILLILYLTFLLFLLFFKVVGVAHDATDNHKHSEE